MDVHHAGRLAIALGGGIAVLMLAHVDGRNLQQTPGASLKAGRSLTYFVSEGEFWSGYRPSDKQLAVWALEDWERSADGVFHLSPASETDALVRVYWARPNGSYGEMRSFDAGTNRGAAVFVRPSIEGLPETVARYATEDPLWRDTIIYLTCLHEIGHALGLSHTADDRDIMYSFGYGGDVVQYFARFRRRLTARGDIRFVSGLSEGDVQRPRSLKPTP